MPNDSYNCTLGVQLSATQTIALNADASPRPHIPYSNYNFGPVTYSAARAANPITLAIYHKYEAIGTSGIEIDFTDLPDINGGTKNATGKQLFLISVTVKTAGKKLLIKPAASNSYPLSSDSFTYNAYAGVQATLVKTQTGTVSLPTVFQLTLPTFATAGYIQISVGGNSFSANHLPYNATPTQVAEAFFIAINGGLSRPNDATTQWTVTGPTFGVYTITGAGLNSTGDRTLPTIAVQGLLSITSTTVLPSIPCYALYPTLIPLGLQGAVVDSTHKKIKLAAVADTLDAEVTLWFIDAVT